MVDRKLSVRVLVIGLVLFVAPMSVACSAVDDVPAKQDHVVVAADAKAGSTVSTKVAERPATKAAVDKAAGAKATQPGKAAATVTMTVTKTVNKTVTRTVTAAPRTVRIAQAPTTVTVVQTAAPVTETVVQTQTVTAAAAQGLVDSGSVYYANCSAARAAGAAPVMAGDPGYRSALDRDGDGIGCE